MGRYPGISSAAGGVSLTAPRLQLRWTPHVGKPRFAIDDAMFAAIGRDPLPPSPEWDCHYELVLPLDKYDVRREVYGPRGGRLKDRSEIVIPIKPPTVRGSTATPCTVMDTGERYADTPFRDGCHARWDSALLGGLPVFVIAPDGAVFKDADTSDAELGPGKPPTPTPSLPTQEEQDR